MLRITNSIKKYLLLVMLVLLPTYSQAKPQVEPVQIKVEQLTNNLGVIWSMEFVSPTEILFTIRSGKLGIYDLSSNLVQWVEGLPEIHAHSQGGLLDVAKSPDYDQTGWLYFTYSKEDFDTSKTTLARAKLVNHQLKEWQEILVTDSASHRNIHYGSRIAFDDQGHLFFSVGDRGLRAPAQNNENHIGSIIRLNLDGSVPDDNPFVGHSRFKPEIWSYGHRNPQGLVFDMQRNVLWAIEHGPRGGDEINRIEKGKNYGWPVVSQGQEYGFDKAVGVKQKAGMVNPEYVYIPSIAPSDLLVYSGDEFSMWQGSLLTGALVLRHLNRVSLNQQMLPAGEYRALTDLNERIRSLAIDDKGRVYVGTDSGKILRLTQAEYSLRTHEKEKN
ncbi:PQQ-dependent sugar dehydrogenase [Thiomicrorhabdus indica]|uniref:PQQ-dependent sugar dehydrogenase n=1 Tax=Thiomicrorhabdus indica TaxID=2267253 RepID=UPI00102DC041|nr:PQQ-dependent sugar dehydrogenase [Thiomicrorhabdus indica]